MTPLCVPPLGHLLEFLVVDVGPVHCKDVACRQLVRCKQEMVVLGSGSELDVTRNTLVGVDDGMHLDASFLLACLRIASHTLENEV